MKPMDLMADVLVRHFGVVEMTLADFTGDELMVRPVPGANHALWQLGHLVATTAYFASLVPGVKVPAIPAEWGERFGKKGQGVEDPKAFAGKGELLAAFKGIVDALAEGVRKLSPEDLDRPTPESLKGFAPTVGHLVGILAPHWTMHVGQFQVIRRKFGKPVLF
jgi:hypothetical protein